MNSTPHKYLNNNYNSLLLDEIWGVILSMLDATSLCRVERTCVRFREVMLSSIGNSLWFLLYTSLSKNDATQQQENSWKRRYKVLRNFFTPKYDFKLISVRQTRALSISPVQSSLIAIGNDVYLDVYDMVDKEFLISKKDHSNFVWGVSIDDQNLVYAGNYENKVRIWDLNGNLKYTLENHRGDVWCIFTYKNWIVTGASSVYLWNRITKELIAELNVPSYIIYSSVCMNDNFIIAGNYANEVVVFEFPSLNLKKVLTGHTRYVRCVTLRGNIIYSASDDNTIRMWSLETLTCIKILQNKDHVLGVTTDGEKIISVGDGGCNIWNMKGELMSEIPKIFNCVELHGTTMYCGGFSGVHVFEFGHDGDFNANNNNNVFKNNDVEEGMEDDK